MNKWNIVLLVLLLIATGISVYDLRGNLTDFMRKLFKRGE